MTEVFRLATDTGGTFTDLIVNGNRLYKSSTTPDDPVRGILDVVDVAARDLKLSRRELLERTTQFVHGTTRATNAVIHGNGLARTGLLVTMGHPDILLWREGGRQGTFDFRQAYPEPYIPRALTREITERIGPEGQILTALDLGQARAALEDLKATGVAAMAVCLLWSIVNPSHEQALGALIEEVMPGVPYTLSSRINPSIREYRRASSAAIDASLKPLMGTYLNGLNRRLMSEGLASEVLVMTSGGAVLPASDVGGSPIHSLASGPAAAPVAARTIAEAVNETEVVIVTDAGGTSFDVSLVRRGRIPWTRETRIGRSYLGPMTGFPSVDVKSIGAGGGSIAWVDAGGMLKVGPMSAGSVPGPCCYGKGGTRPTVTDACLVLGYLDPEYFLGGSMTLYPELSVAAIEQHVAGPLGISVHAGAAAILTLATEHMVNAIEDIAISQGVDPRLASIMVGGGSGGFYGSAILQRLKGRQALVPQTAAALSATGALISDLVSDFAETLHTSTTDFSYEKVNAVLDRLEQQAKVFLERTGENVASRAITFSVEARYPQQMWDLEVELPFSRFADKADLDLFRQKFHEIHRELLQIADEGSAVEAMTWRARARASLPAVDINSRWPVIETGRGQHTRQMYFSELGLVDGTVYQDAEIDIGATVAGPGVIESGVTTIVLVPGITATRAPTGTLILTRMN